MSSQPTRGERVLLFLEKRSPRVVMEQPERVLINVTCILIGVSALLPPQPHSALHHWPDYGRYGWAAVMVLGAVASLLGAARLSRSADRIGALCIFTASSFLAVQLLGAVGVRAMITATIFFGIAAAKLARFIRSTAVRIQVRNHLIELKERQEKEN